jgi:hypothetical protein
MRDGLHDIALGYATCCHSRDAAVRPRERKARMTMSLNIGPIAALIAGILILIIPRLLNYIIAIYLIIVGLVGLFGPVADGGRAAAAEAPSVALQTIPLDTAQTPAAM